MKTRQDLINFVEALPEYLVRQALLKIAEEWYCGDDGGEALEPDKAVGTDSLSQVTYVLGECGIEPEARDDEKG